MAFAKMKVTKTFLSREPSGFRINSNSFQQDAIASFDGAQYFVAYQLKDSSDSKSARLVTLGRRFLDAEDPSWDIITLLDYEQVTDDGHNVACIGISGDGTIHLCWDLHGDVINYCSSVRGLALNPKEKSWSGKQFNAIEHGLSGHKLTMVTYPRFLRLLSGDLLFEFRIGKSGLGDDYLYRYSSTTGIWKAVGPNSGLYLKGVDNNAYVNGIDQDGNGRLHVSWTYRDYVEDRAEFLNPKSAATFTRNAGPNGPENNHDLYYIFSDDEGVSWENTFGEKLASPVTPSTPGIKIYDIPKFSGIMNQEGQAVDSIGNFHALNRENGLYHHYWRSAKTGQWSRGKILDLPAVSYGNRGQVLTQEGGTLYALLPGNNGSSAFVCARSKPPDFGNWTIIWQEVGYDGEPCYDRYRDDGILSIFTIKDEGDRRVAILDLAI